MFIARDYVEAAGLMSYGANFRDLYRRTAELVDKILRGAKPTDIPVEQPTKFDLVINLTTAKALGLTVPPTLVALADEVIMSSARECHLLHLLTTAFGTLLRGVRGVITPWVILGGGVDQSQRYG